MRDDQVQFKSDNKTRFNCGNQKPPSIKRMIALEDVTKEAKSVDTTVWLNRNKLCCGCRLRQYY